MSATSEMELEAELQFYIGRNIVLLEQLAEAVRERDEAREAREQDKESMLYHYHLWLETDEKLLALQALASRLLAALRACQWGNCLHDPACHACPICGHDRDLQVVHAPDCAARAAIDAAEEAEL